MNLIDQALKDGRTALSEYESKQVLASYGIPVTQEVLVINPEILLKVVALFVGIWLIVSGINLLVRAREARKVGAGYWKWELGLGITYLALAVIFLWHPMIPGITIAIWSALAFIILGIFRIAWTIRLKRHMNKQ